MCYNYHMEYVEIDYIEVLNLCDEILYLLDKAKSANSSARGLGLWDILGGGSFVSMMKRSKMNDATFYLNKAGNKLKLLKEELEDIDVEVEFNFDFGFIDVWMDSEIFDLFAQLDISKQQAKINEVIGKVTKLKDEVKEIVELAK